MALSDYDIIVFTETWLSNFVYVVELGFCYRYTIFRCDRDDIHGHDIRGSGVLIAVNAKFSCYRLIIQNNSIEQLFIKINLNSDYLIVGAVYIPLYSDINVYNEHVNIIDNLMCNFSNDKFLLVDDFNLTKVKWNKVNDKIVPNLLSYNSYESNILTSLYYVNLMQYNLIYKSAGSLLDLVFSNVFNVTVVSEINPLIS